MSDVDPLTGLTKLKVLAEIEDVIRAMPETNKLHWDSPEILVWFGRASAAMHNWDLVGGVQWDSAVQAIRRGRVFEDGPARAIMLLHKAQNDLRMKSIGPINVAIGRGYVFDYLDTMRKIIGQAKSDILFVDRYMDGEFVSQFLPHVADGVAVRLLTRRELKTEKSFLSLITMTQAFAAQQASKIEIRTHREHHQRYVLLDRMSCFESGSSFKDGPNTAGATIVEQTGDTLAELLRIHETLWLNGMKELST